MVHKIYNAFRLLFNRFGLFAAISSILKAEMAPHLPEMVKQMIETLQSTEGITVSKQFL